MQISNYDGSTRWVSVQILFLLDPEEEHRCRSMNIHYDILKNVSASDGEINLDFITRINPASHVGYTTIWFMDTTSIMIAHPSSTVLSALKTREKFLSRFRVGYSLN